MFSVTKTELKIFPLWTKNVCPTKSGVTIERRDQVLIAFLPPEAFILSIFSRSLKSTKGHFFNELAIKVKRVPSVEANHYAAFFFAFLLSKMKRSLGLCLLRVLK